MQIEAHAKINWTLDILGQRPDGYHLMDMLMQPITLCDRITLTPADTFVLTTGGTPLIPPDEHNLALRAARALAAATGYAGGAAIHVEKHIPAGAGLGGGSADAAGVLAGLNALWELHLPQAELEHIGLSLGADVPFCLRGGLARVTGIGEDLADLGTGPDWPLIVIQPCEGLSTGAVFRAYHAADNIDRPATNAAQSALLTGELPALIPALGNALESVSRAMQPAIGEAIDALLASGAAGARMSGSGSAVFGVFADDAAAQAAYNALQTRYERTFLCRTCREPWNIL